MAIDYKNSTGSFEDIFLHLETCKGDFIPPLDQRVNVKEYAQKLFEKSERFEAWESGHLVGLLAAYFNQAQKRTSHITNVSVVKAYGGQGIASRLMQECLNFARKQGFAVIELEVFSGNQPAIGLYRKFGFMEKSRKGDLLVMSLVL